VPLFFAIENKNAKQRFILGYIFGIVFFSGILYWLLNVTGPGTVVLIIYLAIFPALFCLLCPSPTMHHSLRSGAGHVVFVPAAWVFTEYIRAHLFSGFPWALLGYSQSLNLPVIQISDITGVYGVSFLVVLVNFGIYFALKKMKGRFYVLFIIFILFSMTVWYGQKRIRQIYPPADIKVAVIQGNIPQAMKWDPRYRNSIINKYSVLTKEALKEKPELVVWPETSIPGYLNETDLKKKVTGLARSGKVNLLIGALKESKSGAYNSAVLFSPLGEIMESYDKIHLVPFGEFLPLEDKLFAIRRFVDKPIGNFARGKEFTVFKLKSEEMFRDSGKIRKNTRFQAFSVLICFEDIFPGLSRNFVKRGARFLVNMTNDAWFGKTSAPYQHVEFSVFRAAENKVPVLRAANTGVSCIIDRNGRIVKSVGPGEGETFVDGYVTASITPGIIRTVYTRFGDVFSWICIIIVFIGLTIRHCERPRAKRGEAKQSHFIILFLMALILVAPSTTLAKGETYYRGNFRFKLPFSRKYDYNNIRVKRVIDGDTVELENRERVRLIGIDTPETRYGSKLARDARRTKQEYETIIAMGKRAAAFTKSLVEGKNVRLEFDAEKRDRYGRTLAYVYLPDGKMLNAEILKAGYAHVYTFQPNVKHVDLFLEMQREAKENERGLWGK